MRPLGEARAGPSPTRQPRAPRGGGGSRRQLCAPPTFLRPRPPRPGTAPRPSPRVGPDRPPAPRAPALTVGGSRSPAQRLRLGLTRGGHAPPRAPSRRCRRPALAGTGGERRELTLPRTRRCLAPRGAVRAGKWGGRARSPPPPVVPSPPLAQSTTGVVVPPGGRCRRGHYRSLPAAALQLPAASTPRGGAGSSFSVPQRCLSPQARGSGVWLPEGTPAAVPAEETGEIYLKLPQPPPIAGRQQVHLSSGNTRTVSVPEP
ncbi:sterile alpha motif domain-containing protein 1-like [Haemorhous mexicanus]|uniref:sterile alpha motif domain-containing protein 1-like n=1 Tax=Haemorhous mexicanus TaxID=30427 RepID=UPI0028BEB225|nr:sterile alpha motif domain-containing protein 1-like [Haemorhous mexicanus]